MTSRKSPIIVLIPAVCLLIIIIWIENQDGFSLEGDLQYTPLPVSSIIYNSSESVSVALKPFETGCAVPKDFETQGKIRGLKRRLPGAIVVGFQKCGTGAVINFMNAHPQLSTRCRGEVYYFNRWYDRGLDWYRGQLPLSLPNQITVEKTASYATKKQVPERVYKFNKDMKIIFAVRNPVEGLISHYVMELGNHPELGIHPERKVPFHSYTFDENDRITRNHSYPYRYYIHVKRWLKYFDWKNIHFVDGENLAVNPLEEMKKIEKFLTLQPFFKEEHFVYNVTKGFYCLHIGYEMKCLPWKKGLPHPFIEKRLLKKLYSFYEKDNEALFNLIGRRFDWAYKDD